MAFQGRREKRRGRLLCIVYSTAEILFHFPDPDVEEKELFKDA